jgi:nucleotide-binding universal stress UspA family protein
MNTILAAIDLGPSSARVLYHAAGFARLWSLPLRVLHVGPADRLSQVRDFCAAHASYDIDIADDAFIVTPGIVSDVIVRESLRRDARMVVMGSRGLNGLARLLLGSTSQAVLKNADVPVLLVPPIDLDIVSLTGSATLTCGPVVAAIDLSDSCDHQLMMADDLAWMAGQPLLLLTVMPNRVDDTVAGRMLRERTRHLKQIAPQAVMVRRGKVADEISECVRNEGAGLVVMGRQRAGRPGAITSAVLRGKNAFVLSMPPC